MEPTSPVRPHRRGAAVRQAVLRATAEIIRTEGLAGARIADIAARAGVHQTSVYRRWGTRANLIREALSSRLDTALSPPDTGSTQEDLTAFFVALTDFVSPEEEARFDQTHHQLWSARLDDARVLIQRGIDRGELRPDIDPTLLLEALAGPVHLRSLLHGEPTDREYVEELVRLVLGGARPAGWTAGTGR